MQFKAVLGNAKHPEYGVANIPFPISAEQYESTMEMMSALGIGDALERDCRVEEITHGWPVLKRLEKVAVNIDELDYLGKRLDSFDAGEADQFQGMAVKLGVFDMTDFINLTFCCQQATVITDFSDLKQAGLDHLMNLNGGSLPMDEYKSADGQAVALDLILHEEGTVTPYGVVYDNGMKLEQLYDGRYLPGYYYDHCVLGVAMTHKDEPEDSESITWLYLPMSQTQIERAMLRAGIDTYDDMRLRFDCSEMPNEVDVVLDFEKESLGSLNEMCRTIARLDPSELPKLAAAVTMAKPEYAMQVQHLAEQLDLFDFAPGAHSAADYGRYMIMESGHFEYDENLAGYYDFEKYGQQRMEQEYGEFTDRGYISYHGTLSLDELMFGSQGERMDHIMGGMGGME
jgi:hypothetical protein